MDTNELAKSQLGIINSSYTPGSKEVDKTCMPYELTRQEEKAKPLLWHCDQYPAMRDPNTLRKRNKGKAFLYTQI